MKLKITIVSSIIITLLSFISLPAYADPPPPSESSQGLGCGGNLGPIAEFLCTLQGDSKEAVGNRLNQVISSVIGFLTIVAALYFLFQIIIAGFSWIGAGGDKTKLEAAQKKLTNSVIGITIVAAAWIIAGLFGKLLGIEILNPGAVLQTIGL